MNGRFLRGASALVLIALLAAPTAAQPPALTIPYGTTGTMALGTGYDIAAPSSDHGQCVSWSATGSDTTGVVQTQSKGDLVTEFESDDRQSNLELGLLTTGKIKYGSFNANSEFDLKGKFGKLRHSESASLSLMLSIYADFGRLYLNNYSLKPDYQQLLVSNPAEFRRRCGTHFAWAEHRIADATIFVTFDGLSRSGKDSLESSLRRTIGAGVDIKGISGEASTTLTANYKNIVEFAKRSSSVRLSSYAVGGSAATVLLPTGTDPADLTRLVDQVRQYSAQFTPQNGAPKEYVMLSYAMFGAPDAVPDLDRLEKVGKLTRKLIQVNDAIAEVQGYRQPLGARFDQYFAPMLNKLLALRDTLAGRIRVCADSGACDGEDAHLLDGYVFLGDIFSEHQLEASCSYQRASVLLRRAGLNYDPEVLEAISLNLDARVPYYDLLDFSSRKIFRLTKQNRLENVTSNDAQFAFSHPDQTRVRRMFGTAYFRNLESRQMLSVSASGNNAQIDIPGLSDRREDVLGSMYLLEITGPGGLRYGVNLGTPDRSSCRNLVM